MLAFFAWTIGMSNKNRQGSKSRGLLHVASRNVLILPSITRNFLWGIIQVLLIILTFTPSGTIWWHVKRDWRLFLYVCKVS